jgi:hypothetical protein
MKIVIVDTPRLVTIEHYNDVANAPLSASLNSGYALAISRRAGWETAFFDASYLQAEPETIAAGILAEGADIVLFHWVYSWGNESAIRGVMDQLKQGQGGLVGAFGLFPTLSRTRLFSYAPGLDFIITGEFEETLEDLLSALHKGVLPSGAPGLALRDTAYVPRELPDDLSWLPVPDDVGANCSYTTMNIAASRGCFGDCGFCFINRFYGCSRRRERAVASLEAEVDIRLQRRTIEQLYFVDPTFIGFGNGQKERIAAISGIAKAAGVPFGFETRVDTVDREQIDIVAKNGAASIFLGIESGCDSVLQRINKRITTQQIATAVDCIRDSGIRLNIGFIMFEPDSTIAELAENYAFLEKLGLLADHELTANLLYHSQIMLSGSSSWERFEQEGRLLLDERLPFEAGYCFKDDAVARVCRTMRRMATEYFLGMERFRNGSARQLAGDAVNVIMKDAFQTSLRHADSQSPQEYDRREELLLESLSSQLDSEVTVDR